MSFSLFLLRTKLETGENGNTEIWGEILIKDTAPSVHTEPCVLTVMKADRGPYDRNTTGIVNLYDRNKMGISSLTEVRPLL